MKPPPTDPYRPLYLCQKSSDGTLKRIVDGFITYPIQNLWMGLKALPAQDMVYIGVFAAGTPKGKSLPLESQCEAGGHGGHFILCFAITSP